MSEVTYVCTECKAVDHDRNVAEVPPPQVLTCYNCGAGRGMTLADMFTMRKGMFPTAPITQKVRA